MKEKEEKDVINKKLLWIAIILFIILCVVVGLCFGKILIKKIDSIPYRNGTKNNIKRNENKSIVNNSETKSNSYKHHAMKPEKPIIYLYPTQKIDVNVKLGNTENLSCTYPKYENGWNVTANTDGSLIDKKTGRKLYALYWEGKNIGKEINQKEGFCVKGEDIAKFLEEKLEILGLNERETEEFIIYWLPQLENNEYNYIRFETMEEQNKAMPLEITPKPDTIIRIMMDWKALEKEIQIKEQKLKTPKREGFTAVEWGGSNLKE